MRSGSELPPTRGSVPNRDTGMQDIDVLVDTDTSAPWELGGAQLVSRESAGGALREDSWEDEEITPAATDLPPIGSFRPG